MIFKNSSRVDVPYNKFSYDIPLLYDADPSQGGGKLYYRIRAVNIKESGNRSDGPWTTSGNYPFNGHSNNLNWQSTSTFAEEGKRKTVIQYFDGSLRGRQTVTKDNSTNTVIAAETFYDGQGRPAIQILPTPGMSTIIKYQANLNLFNGQGADQDPAGIFDMQPVATPNSLTPPLITSSGTSKYYSASNPESNSGFNKLIPDADGYPYSVTRYTPDATGRILKQSGVGPVHKMGSEHETKYYYGSAAQEELDGLFGTEVGNFTHYSKNMVQDANGQISVSYTDMHGRTIATALGGDSPGNMVALDITNPTQYPNQAGTGITRNLLDNSSNLIKGNSVESVNSLLVTSHQNYQFRYELNPQVLQLAICNGGNPQTLCYDCLYDLEITITDESGDAAPFVYKYNNVSLNLDDNCNTPIGAFKDLTTNTVSNVIVINQMLDPGSYSVRKTLSISESSYQHYSDLYLSKALCKTELQIRDSIYNVLLSTSNCANTTPITCQSCNTALGTETNFRNNYLASIGAPPLPVTQQMLDDIHNAYLQAQQNCNRLCNTTSQSLPAIEEMMIQDMIPFAGQYAREDASENTFGSIHTMFDKYNIFSTAVDPVNQPFYKIPWTSAKVKDFYHNETGGVDQTIHPQTPPNAYNVLNNTSPAGFTQLFKNSWAKALLPHHPEYDRLVFAKATLTPSYNWINTFLQTDAYADAALPANGYLNPVAIDPFFQQASAYTTNMTNAIANYQGIGVSMWQLAYGEVRCKSIVDVNQRQICYQTAPIAPPFAGFSTAENDQAWQIFRNLYAAVRNGFMNTYIADSRPLGANEEHDLIKQRYLLWFPRDNNQAASQYGWGWWPQTVPNEPIGGMGNTSTVYDGRCSSYIERWKTQLLQCETLANNVAKDAILTEITTRMQAVCVNGSNQANPYGSSNVAPSTPASVTDRSFEDVIKNVFMAHGIINANGIYSDNYCNPFVIEWPKPYGKGPKMYSGEQTGIVDSCNCKAFVRISTEATAQNYDPTVLTSLNQYLLLQYGETLTPGMFAGLQHCHELQRIICTSRDTVISYDCKDPAPDCPISLAGKKVVNLSQQKEAINSNRDTGPPCDVLDDFIAKFHATYGYPLGDLCQKLFTEYYNAYFGNSTNSWYTWDQIADIYFNACGVSLNVCGQIAFDCPALSTLIFKFHSTYGYPTGDACQNLFVQFFNNNFGSNYTWAQIVLTYSKICGIDLDVCTPPPLCYITCTITTCDTTYTPYVLPHPEPLPDFLKCGYVLNSHCISCARLSEYTGEYKAKFLDQINTAPIFTGTNLTPEQVQYNMNYARFINYRTGFQYGWLDYSQAAGNATPACNLADYNNNSTALQNVICGSAHPLADNIPIVVDPCLPVYTMAVTIAQQLYQVRLQYYLRQFNAAYKAKCLAAKDIEQFTVSYTNSEYHYTLYYYDMAGNLVKTVPPKGVRPDFTTTYTTQVESDKINNVPNRRPHELATQYRYNTLNQVVAQSTPDAGISKFWYDRLGRLVVSQNSKQQTANNYSYTLYDDLGRIKEVGQLNSTTAITQAISQNGATANTTNSLAWWLNNKPAEQIIRTFYDKPYFEGDPNTSLCPQYLCQQNLRNRVSYTAVFATGTPGVIGGPGTHAAATYYAYDIHGNVNELLQDINQEGFAYNTIGGTKVPTGQRWKKIAYNYDLISGKVNSVSYQPGLPDAFYHRYSYDAENRITDVETSNDKIVWEHDARYSYYRHGPLSRTVLGQNQVQGIDYAYTLQGWLKGINSTSVNDGTFDMGQDGKIGSPNSNIARDAYGLSLNYFTGDYKPIGTGIAPFAAMPSSFGGVGGGSDLFNGNIKAQLVNIPKFGNALTYAYKYDQLNRLVAMDAYTGLNNATNVFTPISMDDYKERLSYDPNGNIKTYLRNGDAARLSMDNLAYTYKPNTNQLDKVVDAALNASDADYPKYNDIKQGQQNGNYTYDAIGNLIADAAEGITNIEWTVYGKIKTITKANGTNISYTYDAAGNRISKTANGKSTFYVRDASGNTMSVYEKNGTTDLTQTERHLYGSSRLGINTYPINVEHPLPNTGTASLWRGYKFYELVNHLGNVLVTVSDKKLQKQIGYKVIPGNPGPGGNPPSFIEVDWPYTGPDAYLVSARKLLQSFTILSFSPKNSLNKFA